MKLFVRTALLVAGLLSLCLPSLGQSEGRTGGGMQLPPGENLIGKVTSVGKDSITVTPMTGGSPVTITVKDGARIMKDRQPVKLSDIKVDDMVFARGALNNNSMDALMVSVVNPERLQRFQSGGAPGQGRMMVMGGNAEDMGKKFIAGEVKAINDTKLTIARIDNQTQDIEVDETTSFKKAGESITLADIKPGDFIFATGELKDGAFVPRELNVGRPQMRTMVVGSPETKPGQPADAQPAPPAPPKQ